MQLWSTGERIKNMCHGALRLQGFTADVCVCSQSVLVFGTAPAFLRLVKSCQSWHVAYPDTPATGAAGSSGEFKLQGSGGPLPTSCKTEGRAPSATAGSMCLPNPPEGLLTNDNISHGSKLPASLTICFTTRLYGTALTHSIFLQFFFNFWGTIHPDFNTMFELEITISHSHHSFN